MKKLLWMTGVLSFVFLVLIVTAYVTSKVDPIRWQPPREVALSGEFAPNNRLGEAKMILQGVGRGPEGIAVGPDGLFYTGYRDGRVVKFSNDGSSSEFVNTGGVPLGMQFDSHGNLVVADAKRGLLSISAAGDIEVLTASVDNQALIFVDDLDIAEDGIIWFSDASTRFDYQNYMYDFLEARGTGRLLSYSPSSGETAIHLHGLFFANGVALGPNDDFVLVNETGASRIRRLWLRGERAGSNDIFHEALPGSPDNLTFNGHDTFWVALAGLRNPDLESLSRGTFIRKLLGGLPASWLVSPGRFGFVLGINSNGEVTHNLQAPNGPFFTTTSAVQSGNMLYVGSLGTEAVGVLEIAP